jgi:hypothetical protein
MCCFWVEICTKFKYENLPEMFSDEMNICEIDSRDRCYDVVIFAEKFGGNIGFFLKLLLVFAKS